jgi:hypothetical protein
MEILRPHEPTTGPSSDPRRTNTLGARLLRPASTTRQGSNDRRARALTAAEQSRLNCGCEDVRSSRLCACFGGADERVWLLWVPSCVEAARSNSRRDEGSTTNAPSRAEELTTVPRHPPERTTALRQPPELTTVPRLLPGKWRMRKQPAMQVRRSLRSMLWQGTYA